ncbi:MAG: LamG domain-containing protein, partial [Thaumarchaeota archaeon]|nr:LamG domain-containing protein [Nitrososphaerota archaeon]
MGIFIDEDNPAVIFDGKDDFLKIPSPDISKEISGFTVSVWTKPNYQSGSPKFSIISMKNTFELSINNNLEPEKIATFSIFDGIKWHTIQSKSLINEEWTHIAATFSDSSISIFINGNKENTLDNIKTISIDDGQYVISSLTSISVESDILVGAFENSEVDSFRSYYSGLIDSVVVFDSALDLGQNALNEKSRELDYSTLSENKTQQVDETFQAEPNQFGFVANEEQNNSQEIEEQGSKGFKLQKEDKKKVHEFDDEIEDDEIEFEGKIDEINLESMFFTLVGLILQIFVNDDTEFDEDFDSLNDLAPGFHVDVDVVLSNGSHIATEIEVDEEETEEEKEKEEEEDEEEKENKIKICHVPPGNPDNAHTIEVDESAVEAHLKHGDSLGPCDEPPEETFTVTLKDSVSLQDDVTASKQAPSTFTVTLKDSISLQEDV